MAGGGSSPSKIPKKYILPKMPQMSLFSAQDPAWEAYSDHSGVRNAPLPIGVPPRHIRGYVNAFVDQYIVAVTTSCSFPYTYNGGLYYGCTGDITSVSTLACIDVNLTVIPCDVDSGSYSNRLAAWGQKGPILGAGPALSMFEVFGRTGPQNLRGPQFCINRIN